MRAFGTDGASPRVLARPMRVPSARAGPPLDGDDHEPVLHPHRGDLERLIIDLQRDGTVVRTRSQVVMSRLVGRTGPRDES